MSSAPPNVLFVIVDDHQADALGVAGHPAVQTPVLDALANRGTRFSRASMMGSLMPAICSPARACLMTGCHPFRANTDPRPGGGSEDFVTVPPNLRTLPELMREAGYETMFAGKWHNDRETFLRSFERAEAVFHGGMCDHDAVPVRNRDELAEEAEPRIGDGFSTEIFGVAARRMLQERDRQRPFFAWLSFTSPHDPRTPPPAFRSRYDEADLPLPAAFRPEPAFDNGELDVRDELLAPKPLSPDVVREHLADYYGMITHHDHELGKVLDLLEEEGDLENTIVVYIGDHGLSLGNHGLLGKQNLYEHSIRVPMILAGPGVPAGQVVDQPVLSLDIFATLLELCGLPAATDVDSRSTTPLLAGSAGPFREQLVSVYRDCQRAIRRERWKLIEYHVEGVARMELFDLQADPRELQDRSGDPDLTELIASLRRDLAAWQERVGDQSMPINPGETPRPAGS